KSVNLGDIEKICIMENWHHDEIDIEKDQKWKFNNLTNMDNTKRMHKIKQYYRNELNSKKTVRKNKNESSIYYQSSLDEIGANKDKL
ncbi:17965_t:CDS:1, partial [Gigaspora rosea]